MDDEGTTPQATPAATTTVVDHLKLTRVCAALTPRPLAPRPCLRLHATGPRRRRAVRRPMVPGLAGPDVKPQTCESCDCTHVNTILATSAKRSCHEVRSPRSDARQHDAVGHAPQWRAAVDDQALDAQIDLALVGATEAGLDVSVAAERAPHTTRLDQVLIHPRSPDPRHGRTSCSPGRNLHSTGDSEERRPARMEGAERPHDVSEARVAHRHRHSHSAG